MFRWVSDQKKVTNDPGLFSKSKNLILKTFFFLLRMLSTIFAFKNSLRDQQSVHLALQRVLTFEDNVNLIECHLAILKCSI
jgi:hypothetical protein